MKKIFLLFVACGLLLSLFSCKDDRFYDDDIASLKEGNYYMEYDLVSEETVISSGSIARNQSAYYVVMDDTHLLLTETEAYTVDTIAKTYAHYGSLDLNYRFFDALFADLKYTEEMTDVDGKSVVTCRNAVGKTVNLVYDQQHLTGMELYLFLPDVPTSLTIQLFTESIPENIFFTLPSDFVMK